MRQGKQIVKDSLAILAGLCAGLLCSTAVGDLREGVRLEANGEIIDVDHGLVVPCVTDWNNDGKKDLILGQFFPGKIRLYVNRGTDRAPVFKDFEYLKAGGEEITLEHG